MIYYILWFRGLAGSSLVVLLFHMASNGAEMSEMASSLTWLTLGWDGWSSWQLGSCLSISPSPPLSFLPRSTSSRLPAPSYMGAQGFKSKHSNQATSLWALIYQASPSSVLANVLLAKRKSRGQAQSQYKCVYVGGCDQSVTSRKWGSWLGMEHRLRSTKLPQ